MARKTALSTKGLSATDKLELEIASEQSALDEKTERLNRLKAEEAALRPAIAMLDYCKTVKRSEIDVDEFKKQVKFCAKGLGIIGAKKQVGASKDADGLSLQKKTKANGIFRHSMIKIGEMRELNESGKKTRASQSLKDKHSAHWQAAVAAVQ